MASKAAALDGALLAVEAAADDEAPLSPVGERLCTICLTDPVEVMLLPCRHAVLCRACADEVRAGAAWQGQGTCPLCRTPITSVVAGRFAEDFVRMLTEAERRLDWASVSMYEGMYNHVRLCMSVGAVAGAGAVACFVLMPFPVALLPGAALAATSLAVGYVPWFLTTAAAFERQDEAVRDRPSLLNFFSSDDLKQPVVLATKTATLVVGLPVAIATFFAPYFAYKAVVRPLGRLVVKVIVYGCCYTVAYVVLPTGRAVAWLASKTVQGLCVVAEALWKATIATCGFLKDYVLVPACNGVVSACQALYDYVLVPLANVGVAGARGTYDYVLAPIGRGLLAVGNAGLCGAKMAGNGLWKFVLSPLYDGTCWVAGHLANAASCAANGIASAATMFYGGVIVPVGRFVGEALWLAAKGVGYGFYYFFKGVYLAFHGAYVYILVPVGNVVVDIATKMYAFVLVPSGRALLGTASAICSAIATVGRVTYEYVLAPVGSALVSAGSAVATGISAGASAVYVYVLVPVGATLAEIARAVGNAVSTMAGATFHIIVITATGVHTYVIRPAGEAVQCIVNEAIVPVVHAVGAAVTAVAETCSAAATAACNTFTDAVQAFTSTAESTMQQVRSAF